MNKKEKTSVMEKSLVLLQEKAQKGALTIGEIIHHLSGKGRDIILILLSLPFCQPIQIPGLSTPFGVLIAFFGLRMAFGKRVWLPKQLLAKQVSKEKIEKIIDNGLFLIRKAKPLIHTRLNWVCESPFMKIMNGIMICILGLFLALPLPIPLSNLSAAWAIFLIAIGLLEEDGVFVLIGYFVTLVTFGILLGMALAAKKIFT